MQHPKRKSGPNKDPHSSTRTLLYHGKFPVASIEQTAEGLTLLRKGLKDNAFLPLEGKKHISFQRDHIYQALNDGVTVVKLIHKDLATWTLSLDAYVENHKPYSHPERGEQMACPIGLFFHTDPLQGRLFE